MKLPEPFTPEDFDFVAEHGQTHIVNARGERIAHENNLTSQNGSILVAGHARGVVYQPIGAVPDGKWFYSCDHRWLGVEESTLTLFDMKNGCDQGFIFFPENGSARSLAIHPEGHLIATHLNDCIKLHMPDDKVLSSAIFPGRDAKHNYDILEFSGCGRYLWFAHSPRGGTDCLMLLEVPTLKILDQIEAPIDPAHPYRDDQPEWNELIMQVWARENVLALNRFSSGFDSLTFHRPYRRKIRTHPDYVSLNDLDDNEPIYFVRFHPTKPRFAAFGGLDYFYEWSWPECEITGCIGDWGFSQLTEFDLLDFDVDDAIAYCGDQLLCSWEVVDSGSMTWRGPILQTDVGEFLPNGLFSKEHENDCELSERKMQSKQFPMVAEVSGENGQFKGVFRKQSGIWAEVTEEVGWIETPFSQPNRIE